MLKANVASFWRKIPWDLRHLPDQELRRMAEFAIRSREAEKEAVEAAKMGVPTPARDARRKSGKPGPDDEVVDPKKGRSDNRFREYDGF